MVFMSVCKHKFVSEKIISVIVNPNDNYLDQICFFIELLAVDFFPPQILWKTSQDCQAKGKLCTVITGYAS